MDTCNHGYGAREGEQDGRNGNPHFQRVQRGRGTGHHAKAARGVYLCPEQRQPRLDPGVLMRDVDEFSSYLIKLSWESKESDKTNGGDRKGSVPPRLPRASHVPFFRSVVTWDGEG